MSNCRAVDVFEAVAPMVGDGGVCASDEDGKILIIKSLNLAIEALMKRLDSKGTLWEYCLQVCSGCIGLPEDVLEVRQAWLDGKSLRLRDEWWQGQLSVGLKEGWCGPGIIRCGAGDLIDLGDGYATPTNWPAIRNTKLALVAEDEGDAGVEVQVKVLDEYGHEKEEFLTLLNDLQPVISASHVSAIRFFHKPVTLGAVKAYVYYDYNSLRTAFAYYGPKTTTASFRRKKLPNGYCGGGTMLIKAKRRFVPIVNETDELQICDKQALAWGVQAIAAQRRKDAQEYNNFLTLALNELLKEMADGQAPAASGQIQYVSPFGKSQRGRAWN